MIYTWTRVPAKGYQLIGWHLEMDTKYSILIGAYLKSLYIYRL